MSKVARLYTAVWRLCDGRQFYSRHRFYTAVTQLSPILDRCVTAVKCLAVTAGSDLIWSVLTAVIFYGRHTAVNVEL